ncbi:hypothetical protein [Streptomyces sp. UNOC14_S4]|uniref:hypothetical protein n=1 Tax=Streptomyces sp. UNOC14_S4 TaxID=2872340 RepID=UPI001E615785|nr:hypothetical protein [Streptomyces sp. UNOC14_S4]MCC3770231.1 hypothetical protein [Streptomyces sp. UNOC14_S4]
MADDASVNGLEERVAQARQELERDPGITVSPEAESHARALLGRLADQGPKAV